MATNHGPYRKELENPPPDVPRGPEQVGVFRYDIHQIFKALTMPAVSVSRSDQEKAVQLEFHHREAITRLVFSVQRLNTLMATAAGQYNLGKPHCGVGSVIVDAACLADHILTYLNSVVDDLACGIIGLTGLASNYPNRPIDSIGGLKRVENDSALAPVSSLLRELDNPGSWWELAFKPRVGGRQLLIHNHYYVGFQFSSQDGSSFAPHAYLMSPFGKAPIPSFLSLLRKIFANLFDWLDRLESVLFAHVSTTKSWAPNPACWSIRLPVGSPPGTTVFHPEYFILPVSSDSDVLPWETSVIVDNP